MIDPTSTPLVAASFRRYWWLFLIRGLLGIALGVCALLFPAATLWALVLLIAAYFLIDGVVAVAKAVQVLRSDPHWWVLLLEGIFGIVAALVIFALPGLSLVTLALLVGYWAIVSGVLAIVSAMRLRAHVPGEWLYLLFAAVSIVFGAYVLFSPVTGLVYIAIVIGIYGFVAGITMLALAFRARSAPA